MNLIKSSPQKADLMAKPISKLVSKSMKSVSWFKYGKFLAVNLLQVQIALEEVCINLNKLLPKVRYYVV